MKTDLRDWAVCVFAVLLACLGCGAQPPHEEFGSTSQEFRIVREVWPRPDITGWWRTAIDFDTYESSLVALEDGSVVGVICKVLPGGFACERNVSGSLSGPWFTGALDDYNGHATPVTAYATGDTIYGSLSGNPDVQLLGHRISYWGAP